MKDEYSQDFDFVRYSDWRSHSRKRFENTLNQKTNIDERENADTVSFRDDEYDNYGQQAEYQDTYNEPYYPEEKEYPEYNDFPEEQQPVNGGFEQNDPWGSEPENDGIPHYYETSPVSEELQQEYDFDRERALEQIRLARIKRERADQLARDRLHAEIFLVVTAIVIVMLVGALIYHASKKKHRGETFTVTTAPPVVQTEELKDIDEPLEDEMNKSRAPAEEHEIKQVGGITYVDGILIVNKTYGLPSTYDPGGLDPQCEAAFNEMVNAAWADNVSLWICSGYRSYAEQDELFDSYASSRGLKAADEVSARPGHSEHQTGLCIDVNNTDFSFGSTYESDWIEEHCAEYGFIIRFPKGKEKLTGYDYEPWHIRYVGKELAGELKRTGKCLEEYLGLTSDYELSPDNQSFKEKYAEYIEQEEEESQAEDAYAENNEYNYDYGGDGGYTDYGYDDGNGYTDYGYDYGYDQNYDYGYGY